MLRPASGFSMLWRDIQRAALAVLPISDVEVRSVQASGIAIAYTTGITATARGLRQAALDHGFRSAEESLNKALLLLTHNLILRYAYLLLLSREK